MAILTTLSLIANTFVLNLYGKDVELQKDMPKWVNTSMLNQLHIIIYNIIFKRQKGLFSSWVFF